MWWWTLAANAATLDDAWRAAEGSPDLAMAIAEGDRALATRGLARAALLPKVQLAAGYTWNDQEVVLDLGALFPPDVAALVGPIPPVVVQPRDWLQGSATLLVPVVDVDGWATLHAATDASRAAEADVAVARQRLRVAVATAFFGTLLARDAVEIAAEATRFAGRQEEIARARVAVGDAPPRTALEAEQAHLAARRDALGAAEQQARAEQALRRWTGLAPGTPLERSERGSPETLEQVLGAARPEISAAEARIDASRAAHQATNLGWIPDVSARVTGLVTQNEGFAPDGTFVVAGLDATWTWDGGARTARSREAAATERLALAARDSVGLRLEEEVRGAWASLERGRAASVAATREREAADVRLNDAALAFEEGAIPFVELERAALGRSAAALAERREALAAELSAVELQIWGWGPDLAPDAE